MKALAAGCLSLVLLTAACSDGKTEVDAGADGAGSGVAPDGTGVEVPGRAPDLAGTITAITPFEPITEGCTPAEQADPDGVSSSDDPPVCTPESNDVIGTILVEEDPADPQGGRKISYTISTDTKITGETSDGTKVGVFADFVQGQVADTWTPGPCAQSYPEQCGLEAIRVTG